MTYPHRQRANGFPLCECGAMPGAGPTSTWGADCPVAMRAELDRLRGALRHLDCRYTGAGVADLTGSHCPLGAPCERCAGERGREEARAAALHEAAAVLRGLAREYIARHGGGGDYCAGVFDAASRIEALADHAAPESVASRYSTASDAGIARESEPGAPVTTIYDVEGDL